ncbi:copper amine oxidase [Paenibacillus sambharensis]|uniref:Copper amine oxidase n=1 Tax=Paenibacillus sambharensis TaxID=1803190 RepID=A0A2W1L1M9_9BACL|nr:stalk domain-containing protein [Paenibacillus sambharensis]PZD93848.1 copper amine oxidase [Paenibacillus sambharensis]
MKAKKLLVLVALLSIWGGTMIFADSASSKIKVIVNGSELDEAGVMTDGKTYLPLRQISNSLQALISWDEASKKVTINKPNVHMFLFQNNTVFGKVSKGSRYTFSVWAQVDSLRMNISALKVTIADPSGREELIQSQDVNAQKDNFWFRTKDIRYAFEAGGSYTVRFYMKPDGDEWKVVSEKLIIAE